MQTDPPVVWEHLHTYFGKRCFDIGAHEGETARFFAERFDEVVAFEPLQSAYDVLETTMPANVTCSPFAISHKRGLAAMQEVVQTVGGEPFAQLTTDGHVGKEVVVPTLTLAAAVIRYGRPDFIKIDTEGHELKVLQGGLAFLHAFKPRLFIECHYTEAWQEITDLLPWYEFRFEGHQFYAQDSADWQRHYFMWSL